MTATTHSNHCRQLQLLNCMNDKYYNAVLRRHYMVVIDVRKTECWWYSNIILPVVLSGQYYIQLMARWSRQLLSASSCTVQWARTARWIPSSTVAWFKLCNGLVHVHPLVASRRWSRIWSSLRVAMRPVSKLLYSTVVSYVYNGCLAWYNVVLTHGSTQAWNTSARDIGASS